MAFGMGVCCLQVKTSTISILGIYFFLCVNVLWVTIQAMNIDKARLLHDQLAAICPMMVNHIAIVIL